MSEEGNNGRLFWKRDEGTKKQKKMGEKFYKGGMNWDFRKKKQREIDRVENKGVFLERKGKKSGKKGGKHNAKKQRIRWHFDRERETQLERREKQKQKEEEEKRNKKGKKRGGKEET